MKSKLAIVLLAAVLMLTACTGRTGEAPSAPATEQPQETQIQPTQIQEPEYPGIYKRTWSEEIGGTVVELNSYIILKEDGTGYWIAQDVGMLNWVEGRLELTIGDAYEIAPEQENNTSRLLVYRFQDENGEWIPTVFEKTDSLPSEIQEMLEKYEITG